MKSVNTSRRDFLKMISAAGGGLVIGFPFSGHAAAPVTTDNSELSETYYHDAFIQITSSNAIHFYLPRSEMGQGVYHGLTTLIAEELSTSPDLITVHHASVDKAFNNVEFGVQGTGGSNSMRTHYLPLRQAGANARMAILNAASDQLNAPITELTLQDGQVLHQNQRYPFGDFVGVASQHSPPTHSPLKPSADFLFIGKDRTRIDSHSKSNGSAQFGIDIELPNLMRAVLKRCPVRGGTVKSYDDKTAISMPGVKCIVQVNNGIAVVAESYWQARQASSKIVVEWDLPELAKFSSADFKHTLHTILENEDGKEAYIKGSGDTLLASSETVFTAEYWAPYLSHATMEPMNCTVRIENNQCDVWVGSQLPDVAKGIAALYSEIDIENVTIHSTFLGGGFGRRLSADYVAEATTIAKASGLPIQLIWSREDDMQNDFYRPASLVQFSASVDTNGLLNTFSVKRAGPNIQPYQIENALPGLAPAFIPEGITQWLSEKGHCLYKSWILDESSTEGLYESYDTPNKLVRHVTVDPGLPTGSWRSVGHSISGFFKESFIDEIAYNTQQDPVEFRLKNSTQDKVFSQVIEVAAQKADWGKPKHAGSSQGIAAHSSFSSTVAQVAEVSVINNQIKVHRVVCVVNCGMIVNPDIVRAQMEGGINFALTAALYGNIDVVDGAVKQSNFHDYPILRMDAAPEIDVHIIPTDNPPTGVGEPAVPPLAAAIANAVFAATGKRLRSLPLTMG